MAALTAAAFIAAGASVANTVATMRKKPAPAPKIPTLLTPPDPNDPALTADRDTAIAKRRKAPGKFSPPPTLLTGPNGMTDSATVNRSTLLGR